MARIRINLRQAADMRKPCPTCGALIGEWCQSKTFPGQESAILHEARRLGDGSAKEGRLF